MGIGLPCVGSRAIECAEVSHISYTMCTRCLPDIYTLGLRVYVYIRLTTRAHGITITYTYIIKLRLTIANYVGWQWLFIICYYNVITWLWYFVKNITFQKLRKQWCQKHDWLVMARLLWLIFTLKGFSSIGSMLIDCLRTVFFYVHHNTVTTKLASTVCLQKYMHFNQNQ